MRHRLTNIKFGIKRALFILKQKIVTDYQIWDAYLTLKSILTEIELMEEKDGV
jgi:hypothetical protein